MPVWACRSDRESLMTPARRGKPAHATIALDPATRQGPSGLVVRAVRAKGARGADLGTFPYAIWSNRPTKRGLV